MSRLPIMWPSTNRSSTAPVTATRNFLPMEEARNDVNDLNRAFMKRGSTIATRREKARGGGGNLAVLPAVAAVDCAGWKLRLVGRMLRLPGSRLLPLLVLVLAACD